MTRKLLITHAAGEQEVLLDIVGANYRAYAERHGYAFEAVRGVVDTGDKNRYWSKVALIRETLPHWDVVLWLDCDFVIRRQDSTSRPSSTRRTSRRSAWATRRMG